jgi:AraC-like DNA-binding protein
LDIEVHRQRIPCRAVLVNINAWHRFQSNGEPVFTMLVDPVSELGRMFRGVLENRPFHVFPGPVTGALCQAFDHALSESSRDAFLEFVRTVMGHFSGGTAQSLDDRVRRVLGLFDACSGEDEAHQVKSLAAKVGLSESRLGHLFKEATGIPLKSYIVLHKLQKAYDAILDGETFTAAALRAGFDSPSHFAYTNKLMTGMSASGIIKNSEFLKVSRRET